jgi:hypothetical protein
MRSATSKLLKRKYITALRKRGMDFSKNQFRKVKKAYIRVPSIYKSTFSLD